MLAIHRDDAPELGANKISHDRQTEAPGLLEIEVLRQPDTVVMHDHEIFLRGVLENEVDSGRLRGRRGLGIGPEDEAVLDGVLEQLGEHDGERGGHICRDLAEMAVDPDGYRV
jgi:hypothetical protein